ncbi:flagellar hook-associated protein FlgL [Halomonas beimenensis]|uniref:Flagellar hook-associated protein FlgL n=1 Tax=Halomonas beimenensis TaxID=475662 RepID=A0A291PCU0_9GAMM|nr:flagellar hook-associated protein FlgL [Halomonas beimenensis]ATJ84678.1 flagellar hook-associated protein FlgL [Halomonas beimenensis]
MRISTVTMFEQSVTSLNRQQGDFLKVSEQIASGRRVVNPSDDPQAASRAVGVDQARAVTQQFADSRVSARNSLSQAESVLNSVSDAVTRAKTLMVQASSDTLSDVDRESVASELRGVYEALLGQANATDGNGRYLFGGYQDSSAPFVKDAAGEVQYVGDTNVRRQRIDASRLMDVSDHGEAIFQSVPSGAGYVTEADAANAGSVTFKGPEVIDSGDAGYGERYRVSFDEDAAGDPTFSVEVYDEAGGTWNATALTEEAYNPEVTVVSVGGLKLTLEGEPAVGDSITMGPADEMNTDLFRTFEKAIAALETPNATESDRASQRNTLSSVMRELDNGLDNVLTVRASMGARLNELDVVDSVGGNRLLNYEQTLSDLVDLDYAEAISEYSLRQVGMQAAQKTFADMKGMSLFQFL